MRILLITGGLMWAEIIIYNYYKLPSFGVPEELPFASAIGFWFAIAFFVYIIFSVFRLGYTSRIHVFPIFLFFLFFSGLLVTVVIVSFAHIYQYYGLILDGTCVHNKSVSLYFSIVTFTTLGYGDFSPCLNARFWAANQALVGYFVNAALVGAFVALVIRPSDQDYEKVYAEIVPKPPKEKVKKGI